ncbi:MAG: hypothetical protein AABX89_06425 [Candidatus Thermoplasmatota archaeon]
MPEPVPSTPPAKPPAMPRWVKVAAAVVLLAAIAFLAIHLDGGGLGGHAP